MFPAELPWYKSRIIIGALVSIITKILAATGVLDDMDNEALTDAALLIIGGIADVYIIYQRTQQKAAPAITATATK